MNEDSNSLIPDNNLQPSVGTQALAEQGINIEIFYALAKNARALSDEFTVRVCVTPEAMIAFGKGLKGNLQDEMRESLKKDFSHHFYLSYLLVQENNSPGRAAERINMALTQGHVAYLQTLERQVAFAGRRATSEAHLFESDDIRHVTERIIAKFADLHERVMRCSPYLDPALLKNYSGKAMTIILMAQEALAHYPEIKGDYRHDTWFKAWKPAAGLPMVPDREQWKLYADKQLGHINNR